MRARKWVVAGSLVFIALVFIAGALGLRLLCFTPLPTKDQVTDRRQMSKPVHILLSGSETAAYAKLLSANPDFTIQSWQPTEADLEGLEANLPQVSNLKENGPGPGSRIDHPNEYFRQYLAIVQSGKKLIFVNASCGIGVDDSDEWRHHLQIATDGGKCFWQAFYDPLTQKFSNLMINGVA
jgi:hypothetical protein